MDESVLVLKKPSALADIPPATIFGKSVVPENIPNSVKWGFVTNIVHKGRATQYVDGIVMVP